jgi:DNA-binding transcriptional ArsR family regulator
MLINLFPRGGTVLERVLPRQRERHPADVAVLRDGMTALADPMRLRIVALLAEREQCVCHLTDALGLSQGTVSHHMQVLKRAGLVRDRRDPDDARWVYYSLDEDGARRLQARLADLLDTTHADPAPASCRLPGSKC